MKWNNPETSIPEEGASVIFKTRVLHTKKIRVGTFTDSQFVEGEVPRTSHDAGSVWGWLPFEDSEERE